MSMLNVCMMLCNGLNSIKGEFSQYHYINQPRFSQVVTGIGFNSSKTLTKISH